MTTFSITNFHFENIDKRQFGEFEVISRDQALLQYPEPPPLSSLKRASRPYEFNGYLPSWIPC
jgi:hypothetical protein